MVSRARSKLALRTYSEFYVPAIGASHIMTTWNIMLPQMCLERFVCLEQM